MRFKLWTALICFILICAVSGCGKNENKMTVSSIKPDIKVTLPSDRANAGGPVVTAKAPMIEPAREIALAEGEILVSDFESWPNNLGGEIGVYGALEPDWDQVNLYPYSWVYEPIVPSYDLSNVHAGNNSFRLVNGLGVKRDITWGSFAMDLGPTIDLTVVPKKVESLDVSGYKYLVFWAKGEKGGEKMEFLVRDAHAMNYMPQIRHRLPDLTAEWQKITIPIEQLKGKIDVALLDNIGIAFGKDVGNMEGDTAYIDDFVFTNEP